MRVYADLTSGILSKNLPKLPSGLLAGLLEAGVGFYCKEIKPSTEVRELKKFPQLWGLGSFTMSWLILLELTGGMGTHMMPGLPTTW